MFGLPFFTSLIVTVALVVGFSFTINRGIAKKRANNQESAAQLAESENAKSHA